MSERKWTENQLKAITHKDSDLIVAAAAGSGKTATLTERVIRHITEEDGDISRILIVTFTKAAAEELKVKIRNALTKKSAEDLSNKAVRVKLLMLNSAQISTIHGFCSSFIKENYSLLDLPSGMRIADESEAVLLKKQVMDKTLDSYFEDDVPDEYKSEGFPLLFDNLIRGKTAERLSDVLISVYDTVRSCAEGVEIINKTASNFKEVEENGFVGSVYETTLSSVLKRVLAHFISVYGALIDKYYCDEIFENKYVPTLNDELEMMKLSSFKLEEGDVFSALNIFASFDFKRLPPVKGEHDFKNETKYVRDEVKEEKKALFPYYSFSDKEIKEVAKRARLLFESMYKLLSYFEKVFREEKRQRKFMDYGDLEQFTYELLYDKDGNKTKTAYDTAEKYDEIYIDEYQDCNSLQDAIFAAISKKNRFMVGDVKQSIYSFRGAEPYLFSDYRVLFEDPEKGRALFLSNNFRCSENIIAFSNLVFSDIFTKNPQIPYGKEDELVYSRNSSDAHPVTVALVEKTQDRDAKETEAEYIADTIANMIKNEKNAEGAPYSPKDFVILLRSAKTSAQIYEKALIKRGIAVHNGVEKNFFESSEVLLALCLISAIDNPMRDVQLAGLMQSPLFGFTLDDMIEIRRGNKDVPLYLCLTEYAEKTNDSKCKRFLEKLKLYRKKAQGMQTDKLIWYLYGDTGIFARACYDNDKQKADSRRANLMMLYEYARKFEAGSFKGLYNFINYISEILEKKTKLEAVNADGDEDNGVKIMTVHKSKGLEFPVCFLADASAKLSAAGKMPYKYDRKCGFAVKLKDSTGFVFYKTPMYCAVSAEEHDRETEEEARILYVALTRAQDRLFVTGSTDDADKTLLSPFGEIKSVYSFYNSRSYFDMMRPILFLSDPSFEFKIVKNYTPALDEVKYSNENASEIDGSVYEKVKENIAFEYPYKLQTSLPQKVSVSRLYPDLLDENDDSTELTEDEIPLEFKDPDAIRKESEKTKKGIATHLFMQFCDFDSVLRSGVENERQRLYENGFMSYEDMNSVDIRTVEAFFSSDLFGRINDAKNKGALVKREYRFNIYLDAALFTSEYDKKQKLENEKILVQGVVDMLFENSDGSITLLDYKTDRLSDSKEDIDAFISRHRTQLKYYKLAAERITGKKVSDTVLYSFSLMREIYVRD